MASEQATQKDLRLWHRRRPRAPSFALNRHVHFLAVDGNAISQGGDADTMACIASGIAEVFWGVPSEIKKRTQEMLDDELWGVIAEFHERFRTRKPTKEPE